MVVLVGAGVADAANTYPAVNEAGTTRNSRKITLMGAWCGQAATGTTFSR